MSNIFKQRAYWRDLQRALDKNDIAKAKGQLHDIFRIPDLIFEKNTINLLKIYYEKIFNDKNLFNIAISPEDPMTLTELKNKGVFTHICWNCGSLLFENPKQIFQLLKIIQPVLEKIQTKAETVLEEYVFVGWNDFNKVDQYKDNQIIIETFKDKNFYLSLDKNKMYDIEKIIDFALIFKEKEILKAENKNTKKYIGIKL